MEAFNWNQMLLAAFGGGLTVKSLDIAYQEFQARFSRKRGGRKLVDDHLDPILKAADEIVGKIRLWLKRTLLHYEILGIARKRR